VIDSAEATASEVTRQVVAQQGSAAVEAGSGNNPQIQCFATDSVEKFERLGSRFLGLPVGKVELVDLGG
jgi:glutamate racemase